MPDPIRMNDTGEWRDVVGYEGVYSVSSLGRVRRDGKGMGALVGHVLAEKVGRKGYIRVTLFDPATHVPKLHLVHRLVAAAFIGPCPAGRNVNHKNAIKGDNSPGNLEYVTRSENIRHALAIHGNYMAKGEKHCNAVLTESKVRFARRLLSNGEQGKNVAFLLGVSVMVVSCVRTRRTWKHVA